MIIDMALSWFRSTGGDFVGFEALQPYSIMLKIPGGDEETPTAMLIGARSLPRLKLNSHDPVEYSARLAGPWREYALAAMRKHRRITERREPEFGATHFPAGLCDVEPFSYEWATMPCIVGGARVLITASAEITRH